jgi:poly(ADP-ribose) glycohydrolase
MIFMDALELDVLPVEGDSPIPDIHPPSRLSRELILKAFNGFSRSSDNYSHIVNGLWGCRTFGGNKHIKCTLRWCAAANMVGVPVLRFILAGTEEQ